MKFHTRFAVLTIAVLLGACSGSDPKSAALGDGEGIVGGEAVDHRTTRGSSSVVRMVAVDRIEVDGFPTIDKSTCTGTLIGRDLVLTAGHCVESLIGKKIFPMVIDRKTGKAKSSGFPVIVIGLKIDRASISVREIAVPPGFKSKNGLTSPDLALLRLAEPLPLPKRAVRPRLDVAGVVRIGNRLQAMGYGLTRPEDSQDAGAAPASPSSGLQKKTFTVIPAAKVHWRAERKLPELFYLATGDGQRKGNLCKGDSGAPIFKPVDNQMLLVGVTARSESGCTGIAAATKVADYAKWIRRQAAKWHSELF